MRIFLEFIVFTVAMNLLGGEMTPAKILERATDTALHTSFRAKMIVWGNGQPTSFMYYQYVNSDGIVYSFMKPLDNQVKTAFLVNAKGCFEIIGNTAIRTDYLSTSQVMFPKLPMRENSNTFIVDGQVVTREMIGDKNFAALEEMAKGTNVPSASTYQDASMRMIDYYGYRCYQVQYRYDTEDGLFTNEIIVDAKTFFTYQKQSFNAQGKLISKTIYGDVVIDPVFEKGFFDLPRGSKVIIAKALNDGNKKSSIALDKVTPPPQMPRQPSRIGAWLTRLGGGLVNGFWHLAHVLSYILAAVAVSILVVIGNFKFRK